MLILGVIILAVIFLVLVAWGKLGFATIFGAILNAQAVLMLWGLGEPMLRATEALANKTGGYYEGFHDGKFALAARQEINIDLILIALIANCLAMSIFWISAILRKRGSKGFET